ncbi:hypothetical protein [Sphingomonas paucimobilis]|uniref:Uncharacterized protein n=1 Tax=Sphingomonas paucimobilis TaxID=13689 RepID=A0A7Y2KR05_SPHPI|nr:hypothetical protein [Sphingomonas paucimobilis]MCM3680980.1 hypothetical protein [Sphingomonas paucimobilis]NNG58559.1 hypothetical protein [Sphingomonas paucimobilis]
MSEDPTFCRQRADIERRAAAASDLERVQERHLLSAATWDRMAERGEATQRLRARRAELALPA